ncbi:hypothetical protein QA641_26595 [Bradyrhizobium sp. CB1650]|uniref:hypothetical protein n=1 Tax=Bradyrhizobium sp. CB1650 TaxID=3039153 RepID=UPI002435F6BE|nr:hypothetical protein [Bradyrhizobium sp. CB1650]WGD49199.1 hypothetical protein QA641_26595 [Bradyrhizobium sp. CB1650]
MIAVFRLGAPARARLHALRELYRRFFGENTPDARGRRLLSEWLTPAQLAQFEQHRYFDVVGSHSGKRYRIHYGTAANVHEINDAGIATMGWCFVPSGFLVPGDVMLAQKIALETDERAALALANRFPPAPHSEHFYRRPF